MATNEVLPEDLTYLWNVIRVNQVVPTKCVALKVCFSFYGPQIPKNGKHYGSSPLDLISKFSPQLPVVTHLLAISFPSARDRVSHPYKTNGKIIVMHILIFAFLETILKDKMF
jgi:hypothetical protein